jgi:hypothetical protein|tara:strand:- start:34 stop:444 length:411 start_codon:yes stop_codon:yes gene_type:complete
MAHFAKLDENNIVLRVSVVDNENLLKDGVEDEQTGIDYLIGVHGGGTWKQTSYNTSGGVHCIDGVPSEDQSKAFRTNYAGSGYTYDETRDAFIPPQPYPSWLLNEDTCQWEPPVAYPDDGKMYTWDEATTNWMATE